VSDIIKICKEDKRELHLMNVDYNEVDGDMKAICSECGREEHYPPDGSWELVTPGNQNARHKLCMGCGNGYCWV
jgi:hypothetical protein